MRAQMIKNVAALAVAGLAMSAGAQPLAPTITVPGGTDLFGDTFKAPGQWPGRATAVNFDSTLAGNTILNGAGSNGLFHSITSGPNLWTIGASNEGDLDVNIGVFDASDPRSFPGDEWRQFRNDCGGLFPLPTPPAPIGNLPSGACGEWGRLNNPASGGITYAWSIHPAVGIILASVRDNGRDNSNLFNNIPVGTQYASAWISADDFRGGRGYGMLNGTLSNGGDSMYLSMSAVGGSEEIVVDMSAGWFPYQQGWVGGYSTARGISTYPSPGAWLNKSMFDCATPGLAASVVERTGAGRATITLPNANPSTGMMFLTSSQADSNVPRLVNTRATQTGWDVAIRSGNNTDVSGASLNSGGNTDSFAFLYVPYDAPRLIGGTFNADGTPVTARGGITVSRTGAGVYEVTIPGRTGNDGALFFQATGSIPTDATLPDRAFISSEYNAATARFVVHTRELIDGADLFGFDQPLRDAGFSVFWFDFTNPLDPRCTADFNAVGGATVQDIFDFLSAYFGNATLADFNGNGTITVQDIFDFLAAYFAGC